MMKKKKKMKKKKVMKKFRRIWIIDIVFYV